MTVRNKGLSIQQTLVWDAENRLSQVQDGNGDLLEQYWYDLDSARVKKVSGTTTTNTFFAHYEEEVANGVTTAISFYTFGSMRIAVKRGDTLYYLHGDHLGSTSLTTRGSAETASRTYFAYGAERSSSGDLKTDHTFTGQKRDSTGLMYYNARYYDPALGNFVSPDSLVPNASHMVDYNRFLYARGNPLSFNDPSGYESQWIADWNWKNRYYEAHGFAFNSKTNHWDIPIRPIYADDEILHAVMREDLVGWLIREMKGNIQDTRLIEIAILNHVHEDLSERGYGLNRWALLAKGGAFVRWAMLVRPGAPWDYKGPIEKAFYNSGGFAPYGYFFEGKVYFYDIWATINYGYAGRAAGFTRDELLKGAGAGQVLGDKFRLH